LFIAAYDVESPESLLIEIPEKRAQEILGTFNSDYEYLASSLNIVNKKLMLLNPRFEQSTRKRAATAVNGTIDSDMPFGSNFSPAKIEIERSNDNRCATAMQGVNRRDTFSAEGFKGKRASALRQGVMAAVDRPMTQAHQAR